jgi:RNA polymerase sigma-70 factor (ECF subfamily)
LSDVIARARAHDEEAFQHLVEPHRSELQVHCYRMLGSLHDAEDVMQETLMAAWRGLDTFQERSSVRTWLYRIATNRCLNWLRGASRRAPEEMRLPVQPPEANRLGEVAWLEPYPDAALEGLPDTSPGPEALYESRESISLAFTTVLQLLPPRQRAVLVLRDVLGFRAGEVAHMLETTEESVTSALKRARASAQRELPAGREGPPAPESAMERALVERLTQAYTAGDLDQLVALLTDDVRVAMPPVVLEFEGLELATRFLRTVAFRDGRRFRLVATRANRQPAFGVYVVERQAPLARAIGLQVFTLVGPRIAAITHFADTSLLSRFGLPRSLSV